MNDYKIRKQQLEKYKDDYRKYFKNDEWELCNSIIRHATFICDKLNLNVIAEFSMLASAPTTLGLIVEGEKLLTCQYCSWTTDKGIQSLRAHIGMRHKQTTNEKMV